MIGEKKVGQSFMIGGQAGIGYYLIGSTFIISPDSLPIGSASVGGFKVG